MEKKAAGAFNYAKKGGPFLRVYLKKKIKSIFLLMSAV